MKKWIWIFVAVLMTILVLYNVFALSLDGYGKSTITYRYGEVDFTEELTEEEVSQIVRILDGKLMFPDNPSCGFTERVSFTIDGVTYALALDGCEEVKNCNNGKYIGLSSQEREILEAMFVIRGGVFPSG